MKHSTPTSTHARLFAGTCLVVAALGITSVAATGSASAEQRRWPAAVDQSAVAEWAGTTGVSGLSPASLRLTPATSVHLVDLTAVAEWAEANGVSGLSPASVGTTQGGK